MLISSVLAKNILTEVLLQLLVNSATCLMDNPTLQRHGHQGPRSVMKVYACGNVMIPTLRPSRSVVIARMLRNMCVIDAIVNPSH